MNQTALPPVSPLPSAATLADRIRAEPMFSRLSGQALARLLGGAQVCRFGDGEPLAQAAANAEALYLVIDGGLELSSLSGAPQGQARVVGEEVLAGQPCYLRSAIARGDTLAVRLPRQTLSDVLGEAPGLARAAQDALLVCLGGAELPTPAKAAGGKGARGSARETWGWSCTLFSPLAVLALGLSSGWSQSNTLFLAILAATVCMWSFSLVDEFVPPLFATAAMLLVDLAPTEVVLSGFASSGLILFVGVYVLGGVMVASGLSYRFIIWLRTLLPDTPFWHGFALVLSGYALSPIMSSANARMTLILPLYRDFCSAGGVAPGSRAQTRLAAATFCGALNMSPMFLTSKSSNLIVFAMLPAQLQDEFQGLFWFVAALVCAAIMTGGHFILERLLFKGEALPPMPKEQVRRQLALLGPLCAEEKFTLLALVLFLGGAISISWHHISLPWIAGFILVALLLYGLVSKKNFQQYVDWPMVFFLLSLQGLTSTMEYLDLVGQIKPWMDSAAALLQEDVTRLVLLELAVVLIVRLAFPITAGMVVSAILLMPLALATGINPWVIGFLAAMFSDMWFFPYQSSQYTQLRGAHGKGQMFDEPLFLRYNLATCALRIVAVFASIPYWDYLGLV